MSTVYSVDVRIVAPVNDTEVTDRVADAVTGATIRTSTLYTVLMVPP